MYNNCCLIASSVADRQDALLYLLDPCLDVTRVWPWQHTVTIKALLYQQQHALALRYIRTRKPTMHTPEDVKLRLTVLLANGYVTSSSCRSQIRHIMIVYFCSTDNHLIGTLVNFINPCIAALILVLS